MRAIFQKKGKKGSKKGIIFENLGKNVQNLKIFWKRAASFVRLSHAWNSYNYALEVIGTTWKLLPYKSETDNVIKAHTKIVAEVIGYNRFSVAMFLGYYESGANIVRSRAYLPDQQSLKIQTKPCHTEVKRRKCLTEPLKKFVIILYHKKYIRNAFA